MSNPINELSGTVRDSFGKGPSRVLRKAGMVPGVVYGKGSLALSVAIDPKPASKMLLSPLRRNILIHLNLDGQAQKTVMVKDLQIDPVRRNLTHIDFIEIDPSIPVEVEVPFSTFGKSKSVVAGGKLEQVNHTIRVKVLPSEIPVKLELDITDLEFGSTPARAIPLPAGVALACAPEAPVVTIKIPRAEKEDATSGPGAAKSA
ncbi:MAG: 50S ribosomal protein L25 [Myxococcaceae bacterium]|nr:50S ribosomal protein L25 [Myxococcaceae bacterium]MBH2006341.1 50S ribosomal protein L25 [Myxococcaceae bacterium]